MEHDLTGPIPPCMTRISVRYGEYLYVCEYPTDRISRVVGDFEAYAGTPIRLGRSRGTWIGVEGASSVANRAVREDMIELLAASAMWMYLNRPGQEEEAKRLLARLIEEDGGAWLVATTDEDGIHWAFSLSPVELSRHGKAGDPPKLPGVPGGGLTVH